MSALSNASVGAQVELSGPGTGGAAPDAGTDSHDAGAHEPDGRIRLMWHYGWSGPSLSEYPSDVISGLSHVSLGMSQSAESGTGKLKPPPGIDSHDVAYAHSQHVIVLAGIGGSNDGGIAIESIQTAQQAIDSLLAFRTSLGIDGVDIDLEPSGSNWNTTGMNAFISGCLANGLRVGITSALYSSWTVAWGEVVREWADRIEFWASMDYDFPEAEDSRLGRVVVDKIAAQREWGIADRKIVQGFMPRPSEGRANTSPPGVIPAAYAAGLRVAPELGWMIWEDDISRESDWLDARALLAATN